MDHDDKIKNLEERIKTLEDKLNKIAFNEAKEVILTSCPIGDIVLGDGCNLNFQHCPIGSVIDKDLDEAESRLDELECRIDDMNSKIDETESRIDDIDGNTY